MSRRHAEIFFVDNKFYLKDLKSTSGTSFRLQKSIPLEKEMRFEIGIIYKFKIDNLVEEKIKITIENEENYENMYSQELDFKTIGINNPIFIGHNSDCHIKLRNKKKISDKHCKIYLNEKHEFMLEDLKSNSG